MPIYTNAYKGRANRRESADHLKDEFLRIEAAFAELALISSSYSTIYNHEHIGANVLIDPSNGLLQELTLTQDILLEIKDPESPTLLENSRMTLVIHGSNFRIINGWGPQTWKEIGFNDWNWLFTGAGQKGSAVLEFAYDGKAWVCVAFTRNDLFGFSTETPDPSFDGTEALFPLTANLTETTGQETWVMNRTSYAGGLDADATYVILPPDQARFTGNRYLKNWISTPSDLQAIGWKEDGATVSTQAGEGQDGGDVDKITFDITGGEIQHWLLPHFGRSSSGSDPIKFAVSFDAKMAGAVSSGSCRAVIAIMGVESGSPVKWHRVSLNLTDSWRSYGAILDPVTGKDNKGFDLTNSSGGRTLVKFAIESPSDGTGNPILVENVNVVILKEGDAEKVELPQVSTIGASMALTATAGSTGTWVDGTKTLTLANAEFVDFQDALTIGKSYLVDLVRVSGNSADVRLDDGRTFWTGNSKNTSEDDSFVKDAAFTIQYEGGAVALYQTLGSSVYSVNIYEIDGEIGIFDTLNVNTIDHNNVITYTVGEKISSNIAVGVVYATDTVTNLLGIDEHRDFTKWLKSQPMTVFRGEYGIDARPSHGTLLQDNQTSNVNYIAKVITIPEDTQTYVFSIYIRKLFDGNTQIVFPEYDQVVTSASKYVDIALSMLGGTGQYGAGVRVNMRENTVTAPANDYDILSGTNFEKWIHLFVGYTNNGTNNQAVMQVFPAGGTSPSSQILATTKGWCIIDWATLEDASLRMTASDITVPGTPRTGESLSSNLVDGELFNTVPEKVGDITGGVVSFDEIEIYRNITWIQGADIIPPEPPIPTNIDANLLHEFGPQDKDCSLNPILDEEGNPLFDEEGNLICPEDDVPALPLVGVATLESVTAYNTSAGTPMADARAKMILSPTATTQCGTVDGEVYAQAEGVHLNDWWTDNTYDQSHSEYASTVPVGYGAGEYVFRLVPVGGENNSFPTVYSLNSLDAEQTFGLNAWNDLYCENALSIDGLGGWQLYSRPTNTFQAQDKYGIFDIEISRNDGAGGPTDGHLRVIRWKTAYSGYSSSPVWFWDDRPLPPVHEGPDRHVAWGGRPIVNWYRDRFSCYCNMYFYENGQTVADFFLREYYLDQIVVGYQSGEDDFRNQRWANASWVFGYYELDYLIAKVVHVSGDLLDDIQATGLGPSGYDVWMPAWRLNLALNNTGADLSVKESVNDIYIGVNSTYDGTGGTSTLVEGTDQRRRVRFIAERDDTNGSTRPPPDLNPPTDADYPERSPMKLLIGTTAASQVFTIRLDNQYAANDLCKYQFKIDWGDGSYDYIYKWDQAELAHTYVVQDDYVITITGNMPTILWNPTEEPKVKEIQQWGDTNLKSLYQSFKSCTNLTITATDLPNLSKCISLRETFMGCTFATGNFANWDVTNIETMLDCFALNSNFNDDLSQWKPCNCDTFYGMFQGCDAFNQNLSAWPVGRGENFRYMFYNAFAYNQPMDNWDMSNAEIIAQMFLGATAFDQDVSSWNIGRVSDSTGFMQGATAFSTANYDLLLNAWSLQTVTSGLSIQFASSYTIATSQAARDILTDSPNSWTIIDLGGI